MSRWRGANDCTRGRVRSPEKTHYARTLSCRNVGRCARKQLTTRRWITIGVGWDRWQFVAFRLQLFLNFLDRSVQLLIFPAEFLGRIVIYYDIGINSVAFNDPVLALFRVGGELRLKELTAINQREGIANTNDAPPGPLTN